MRRDSTQSPEAYADYLAYLDHAIKSCLPKDLPNGAHLMHMATNYAVHAALAAYSAGHPIQDCRDRLATAVSYWEIFLQKGCNGKIHGINDIDFAEILSAACLVDRGPQIVQQFQQVYTGIETIHHGEKALVRLLCALFSGAPSPATDIDTLGLTGLRHFSKLPLVCEAIISKDHSKFAVALETFLLKSWKPAIDRSSKGDLEDNHYFGRWSLLAAAACRIFGTIPPLSKSTLLYLPKEWV